MPKVNLRYRLDPSWTVTSAHSPDASCNCSAMVGTKLLKSITDPGLRHLFQMLLERVLSQGQPVSLNLRCDTTTLVRESYVLVRRVQEEGRVLLDVENGTLCERERSAVALLDPRGSSGPYIKVCSWCKKIEILSEVWVEVEHAMTVMDVFHQFPHPQLTHGMCPQCQYYMQRNVDFGGRPTCRASLREAYSDLSLSHQSDAL